jgi:hypothetical protein
MAVMGRSDSVYLYGRGTRFCPAGGKADVDTFERESAVGEYSELR